MCLGGCHGIQGSGMDDRAGSKLLLIGRVEFIWISAAASTLIDLAERPLMRWKHLAIARSGLGQLALLSVPSHSFLDLLPAMVGTHLLLILASIENQPPILSGGNPASLMLLRAAVLVRLLELLQIPHCVLKAEAGQFGQGWNRSPANVVFLFESQHRNP